MVTRKRDDMLSRWRGGTVTGRRCDAEARKRRNVVRRMHARMKALWRGAIARRLHDMEARCRGGTGRAAGCNRCVLDWSSSFR